MAAASRRVLTEVIFELEQRDLDLLCADVDNQRSHNGHTGIEGAKCSYFNNNLSSNFSY